MKTLFDPTELKHLHLKNRIFRSATWEALAESNGAVTDRLLAIYEELAKGGVGTIVTGCTDVCEYNNAADNCMRLYSDAVLDGYRRLTETVHRYDCNILTQLNMDEYVRPDPITGELRQIDLNDFSEEDITRICELYVSAAKRAERAGFDGVMIHTAYGYLLNRSFDPRFNRREDAYGGSAEKRAQLAGRVISAVRSAIPTLHLSAKLSFYYNEDGSFAVEDCAETCRVLADCGLDSLEVCGQDAPVGDRAENAAIFLPLALAVRERTDVPLILVGGHRNIDEMESVLNEYDIAYFSMSRPLIREPALPARWQSGDRKPSPCVHCSACFRMEGSRCVFNKGTRPDKKREQFAAHIEKIH